MVTGWNLIGFKSTSTQPVNFYLTGTDFRLPIYQFTGSFSSLTDGTSDMLSGRGFWVYLNANGVITPS